MPSHHIRSRRIHGYILNPVVDLHGLKIICIVILPSNFRGFLLIRGRLRDGIYLLFYTLLASLTLLVGIFYIYFPDSFVFYNEFFYMRYLYLYLKIILAFLFICDYLKLVNSIQFVNFLSIFACHSIFILKPNVSIVLSKQTS